MRIETGSMPRTMGEARAELLQHRAPHVLLVCLTAAVAARLWVGGLSPADLLPFVTVLTIQPFLEWTLHKFLLHAPPGRIAGRRVDTVAAREHRRHHQDPRNLELLFIPGRWLLYLIAAVLIVGLPLPGPLRLSFYVAAFGMAMAYQWSHFLIHTDYKPRSPTFRHLYDNHRWHHYRNEKYWFGVTNTLGDRILGTDHDRSSVPVSPTAKDLLGIGWLADDRHDLPTRSIPQIGVGRRVIDRPLARPRLRRGPNRPIPRNRKVDSGQRR